MVTLNGVTEVVCDGATQFTNAQLPCFCIQTQSQWLLFKAHTFLAVLQVDHSF